MSATTDGLDTGKADSHSGSEKAPRRNRWHRDPPTYVYIIYFKNLAIADENKQVCVELYHQDDREVAMKHFHELENNNFIEIAMIFKSRLVDSFIVVQQDLKPSNNQKTAVVVEKIPDLPPWFEKPKEDDEEEYDNDGDDGDSDDD